MTAVSNGPPSFASSPGRPRRAWRVLGRIAGGAGLAVTFTGALVGGILLHLDTPVGRRVLVAHVNPVLASALQGTLQIEGVEHVGLYGAEGVSARMVDDEGVVVVRAGGLRAHLSVVDLIRSLLATGRDLRISISSVDIDWGEVNLDTRADGRTRIEAAFTPRPTTPGGPARPVRVDLPRIEVRHAWVHGTIGGAPRLDADADDVHASVHVASGGVRVDATRLAVRTRGMPRGANVVGDGSALVVLPSRSGRPYSVDAALRGTVGAIPATAHFTLDGAHLEGTADVPIATAAAIRALVPEVPIHEDASAHLALRGELPRVEGDLRATLGAASLEAKGDATLSDAPFGTVHLAASGVDMHTFAPTAPASSLGATARVSFLIKGGAIGGDYDADVARGAVRGTVIPRAMLRGDYRVATGSGAPVVTVSGSGKILEDGAPTDVVFAYTPDGASQLLAIDARASVARLGATRLGGTMTGRADVQAIARVHVPEGTFEGHATVDVDDAAQGPLHVGHAHVEAQAMGPLAAPGLTTAVDATGLSLGALSFADATLKSDGSLDGMNVVVTLAGSARAPDVQAQGVFDTRDGARIRDVNVTARRGRVAADLHVDAVRAAGGEIQVDGAVLKGLGEPLTLSGRRGPTSAEARAVTKGLDLALVGGLLGMADRIRGGALTVDADLKATERAVHGTLTMDLRHADGFASKDANAHLDATFAGRAAAVRARASEAGFGRVEVKNARVEIPGDGPLRADAWKSAWGDVEVEGQVALSKLAFLVPHAGPSPIGDVGGNLSVRASAWRAKGSDSAPSFHAALETSGLTLATVTPARAANGTVVLSNEGRRLEGFDLQVDASLDGPSGDVGLDGRVVDRRGILVSLDARATALPYREIAAAPDTVDALLAVPFSARAFLPRRPFSAIPFVGDKAAGDVTASIGMQGTVLVPVVDVSAHMFGAKSPQAPITNKLDVDLVARYAAGLADATLEARTPKGKVLAATAHLEALLTDFVGADAKKDPPWVASANAKLDRFPLVAVAALSDRQVRGRISGQLEVAHLHGDASAKASLSVDGLEIGTARFATAKVDATVAGGALHGAARLDQPGSFVDARADVGVTWGALLVPKVDGTKPALLTLRAQSFPLAALTPFVEPAVADLSGKLDADARYSVPAGGEAAHASGTVSVHDATVQITSLGQELHGVQGKLTLSEGGVLRLEGVQAFGTSGMVMAAGVARLNGLRVAEARAAIRVPKGKPIPVGVQGVQMGDMYGDMQVVAVSSADGSITNIDVEVPTLHVRLPDASPHAVQPLDEPKKVRIGTFRAPGQFVTLPIDGEDLREPEATPGAPTRVNVAFHLGQDVAIERGRTLRVALEGTPEIHVSDKTRMSGQIRLKSGTLEVQNKHFEIERGTVSFVGDDPSNPEVVVTAGWTASDGTRVLADFSGPLKTGKVTLRSEPGRPQNEILALILFGTADGSSSTPYAQPTADGATRAGTAAGGLASGGLSKGIDSLTGLDVETKVDTTDSANPRPEVELRIAKDISLQIAVVLGTPPPGTNPDRTFATIDWRFLRNWSLATTFGDQGSSMADVVWRYRY